MDRFAERVAQAFLDAEERRSDISPNAWTICDWTEFMAVTYGGIVRDQAGHVYDWGQALAREQYGLDWLDKVPDSPTDEDVLRAQAWKKGDWPDWITSPKGKEPPDVDRPSISSLRGPGAAERPAGVLGGVSSEEVGLEALARIRREITEIGEDTQRRLRAIGQTMIAAAARLRGETRC